MQRNGSTCWRGKGKRVDSIGRVTRRSRRRGRRRRRWRRSSRRRPAGTSTPDALASASCSRSIGPDARLERVVVSRRDSGPELPLVAEQRGLVDVRGDVVERDALDDLRRRGTAARRPGCRRRPRASAGAASTAVVVAARAPASPAAPGRSAPARSPGPRTPVRFSSIRRSIVRRPSNASLAVEQPALVDLAEVALDVACGSSAAPPSSTGMSARPSAFSSSRLSRMISVDFTSRPLMPMASASTSLALAIMSAIGTLMPRLWTS